MSRHGASRRRRGVGVGERTGRPSGWTLRWAGRARDASHARRAPLRTPRAGRAGGLRRIAVERDFHGRGPGGRAPRPLRIWRLDACACRLRRGHGGAGGGCVGAADALRRREPGARIRCVGCPRLVPPGTRGPDARPRRCSLPLMPWEGAG